MSELLQAVYRGDQARVDELLAAGSPLDVFEAVQLLVERGAEVNSASRNQMKVMPLHSAAAAQDPDTRYKLAKLLLESGADPNARQQDEFTPLMAAEQHGDERLKELLVQHGAAG